LVRFKSDRYRLDDGLSLNPPLVAVPGTRALARCRALPAKGPEAAAFPRGRFRPRGYALLC
jgi:hypothetical protein